MEKMLRIAMAAGCVAVLSALSETNTFTGGTKDRWEDDTCWSLGRVPTAEDDVFVDGATVTVRGAVNVKSLMIAGDSRVTFVAAPMGEIPSTPGNLYRNATVVGVRGHFAIDGTAKVVVENDLKTGAAVKFETGSFSLGEDAELTASGKGWFWYESAGDPLATLTQGAYQTRAPGAGGDDVLHGAYNRGGGHGAKGGNSNGKYGNDYGFKYAPFLPGSPNGIYDGKFSHAVRAGGTVWLACRGRCALLGKVTADGCPGPFGAAAGGGIWIAAKQFAVGARTSVSAVGGTLTGAAIYASRSAGGRVSLALGLTRAQLDALAGGGLPAELGVRDTIGLFPVDVRGGFHPAASLYGNTGTATTVFSLHADPVEVVASDYLFESEGEVRRPYLGHSVSNRLAVVWQWGGPQVRALVHEAPNGCLRTSAGFSGGDLCEWVGKDGLLKVEAVPDAGYAFSRWTGRVPEGAARMNPLEVALAAPAELTPVFRPVAAKYATLAAASTNGVARYEKPVALSGKPECIGIELEAPVSGGTAVAEVVDKAGKSHVFSAPAQGDFPLVELEGGEKLLFPLSLKRAEIEGAEAKVKSVRAIYAHALGRAARHFASIESRSQPLDGVTVGDEPAEVEIDLAKRDGVRFVVGESKGSKLEITWDDGTKSVYPLGVGSQTEEYLADFAGLPKGTKFTIPDSYVTFGSQINQYVRPFLRPYRSRSDMVEMGFDYIADHEQLPGAAAHVNDLVLRRTPGGLVELVWDGSLNNTIGPPRGKPGLKAAGAKFVFAKGAQYALKPDDAAGIDTDRYELLDFAANPRAKAMKDAVFADGTRHGLVQVGGVPVRLAKPLDSGDVAICHYGKGSWALEVDEYTGRRAQDGFGAAVHFRVPARDYVKAHVVFALDPDAAKDKILTLRLAHYFLNGAGSNMIGDARLDLTDGLPPSVTQIGALSLHGATIPLYAATVALDLAPVLDSAARGGYIDFEFMGAMNGSKPDPSRESAFNIFGATLEAAPATLDIVSLPGSPSNVFTQDEAKKALKLVLRGERADSRCKVSFKATDFAEKKTLFDGAFDVGPLARGAKFEREIDLSKVKEPGLYKLFVEVGGDGGATDYAYCTRFAVLPPAGRVADAFTSPYATWWFYGSHGSPSDWDVGGPIMRKAGIRKTSHHNWPTNALEKYGVTFTGNVRAPSMKEFDAAAGTFRPHGDLDGEAWFVSEIQKQIDAVPYADHIMVWHESGPKNGIPEEILDLPVPEATDDDKACGAYINEIGRIVRRHFPKLRIQIGNNSASLGASCRPLRGGAKPEYYDSVGIETPSQTMMPERLLVWGLQGMMMTKEAASYYAKKPVPAAACFEYVYRTDRALGEELQAAWYMRDTLISLANRMPMISPAILFDVKNAYYDTLWGRSGMFYRAPYAEPKLSYVAYAALTKALDGVTLVKELDTGSSTVYALLFRRADGRYATAVWCARGEAELEFAVEGGGEAMDFVGKVSKLGRRVQASEFPSYVLTDNPVKGVGIVRRGFAQAAAAEAKAETVFAFADAQAVSNAPDARITSKGTGCLPMMRPSGHFRVASVDDAEKGRCLEVSLDTSAEKVNRYYTEFTTLRLAQPVVIEGGCERIGVMVKGNSSWGQVRFEIEDADGETFVNYAHPTLWDTLDWQGLLCVNFDGWAYVSCKFSGGLSYDRETGLANAPWSREATTPGRPANNKIDFPVTLKALTVGINRMKLGLVDFKETVPSIRLGAVKVVKQL